MNEPKAFALNYIPVSFVLNRSLHKSLFSRLGSNLLSSCLSLLESTTTLSSVTTHRTYPLPSLSLKSPLGGILKTLKEADAESLQAGWYPRISLPSPLRAHDILYLIELAAKYHQQARHPLVLPQELPCSVICLRLVVTFTSVQTVWVLVGMVGIPHLPIAACGFTLMEQRGGIKVAILRLLQECLTLHNLTVETKGLLGLQHLGRDQTDGICLNALVTVAFRNPGSQDEPPKIRGENYFWWKVIEGDLQSQLLQRLQESSVVPVNR